MPPDWLTGDLLIVNQHTWVKISADTFTQDHCDIFNKYCVVNVPRRGVRSTKSRNSWCIERR